MKQLVSINGTAAVEMIHGHGVVDNEMVINVSREPALSHPRDWVVGGFLNVCIWIILGI